MRTAWAGGEGDGKNCRVRGWDLKSRSENKQSELKYRKATKGVFLLWIQQQCCFCWWWGKHLLRWHAACSLHLELLRGPWLFGYFGKCWGSGADLCQMAAEPSPGGLGSYGSAAGKNGSTENSGLAALLLGLWQAFVIKCRLPKLFFADALI